MVGRKKKGKKIILKKRADKGERHIERRKTKKLRDL